MVRKPQVRFAGAHTVYAVCAGLFALSAVLVAGVHYEHTPGAARNMSIDTLLAGVRFVRHRPVVLGAISIVSSIIGTFFVSTKEGGKIMNALYKGVIVSAAISAVAFYFVSKALMGEAAVQIWECTLVGLALTAARADSPTRRFSAHGRRFSTRTCASAC